MLWSRTRRGRTRSARGSGLDGAAGADQGGHDLVGEGLHLLVFFFPGETGAAEHHAAWKVVVAANFFDAQDAFDHLLDGSAQTWTDCCRGGWRRGRGGGG